MSGMPVDLTNTVKHNCQISAAVSLQQSSRLLQRFDCFVVLPRQPVYFRELVAGCDLILRIRKRCSECIQFQSAFKSVCHHTAADLHTGQIIHG